MRVLVVDDERHSREGLRDSLGLEGHVVETVADGWQAVERIKGGRFEAAIVNVDLEAAPGRTLTGWDFARILRAYSERLILIVMTVETPRCQARPAWQAGAFEVLEKPISPARLKALLRDLPPPLAASPRPAARPRPLPASPGAVPLLHGSPATS
jgi:CheY-like chemotaxis protein